MAQSVTAIAAHARSNAIAPAGPVAAAAREDNVGATAGGLQIAVTEDLAAIERDWRAFEAEADGTVFQTFEYLSTWHRHVGTLHGVRPAIVTGRDGGGAILFLLPLATRPVGFARALEWFGSDLCDYNAPLLAPNATAHIGGPAFCALWSEIALALQNHPRLAFDFVNLSKMPERVGAQANPMLALGVDVNPSGAYLTALEGTWDSFYAAKRSSSTRRRDRTKRKRLSDLGEIRLVNAADDCDILATLDTLMTQKARSFARMGVANLFAHPGYRAFYRALATGTDSKPLVHVSRLEVGDIPAAINLGLVYRGCYYHLLASYDDGEVSRFGPGTAHLQDLLQYAIERSCRVFDFTIGDERYKRDWCDTELKLYDHISAATPRGALVAGPARAARRLKRWIKQTPILWDGVSRARTLLGSLRAR